MYNKNEKILVIDTNIFKYVLDNFNKCEDPHLKQNEWKCYLKEYGKPYITSATLCEYLTSRLKDPDEVRTTIKFIIDTFRVISDTEYRSIGKFEDPNNPYRVLKMENEDIIKYISDYVVVIKSCAEINYLYAIIETARRIYLFILQNNGILLGKSNELKEQLSNIYGENNEKFVMKLISVYKEEISHKEINRLFSSFFYDAMEECLNEIDKLIDVEKKFSPISNTNIFYSRLSLYIEDKDLKKYINQATDQNKKLFSMTLNNSKKEEYVITDLYRKVISNKENINIKKNDCIDISFVGGLEIMSKTHNPTFITADKKLSNTLSENGINVIRFTH